MVVIAVDGKSLRGSGHDQDRCRHLLAAPDHTSGIVLGQRDVDLTTNEITVFATLLDQFVILGKLITADALHTETAHTTYLIENRGAHHLLCVKRNQCATRRSDVKVARPVREEVARKRAQFLGTAPCGLLHAHAARPVGRAAWQDVPVTETRHDKAHGRIEQRTLKVVTVEACIGFPHAAQAVQVIRRVRKTPVPQWRTETV